MSEFHPALDPAFFLHDLYDADIDRRIEGVIESYPDRDDMVPIVAVGHDLFTFVRGTAVQVFQETSCTLYELQQNGRITHVSLGDTDPTDRAHFDPVLSSFFDQNLSLEAFPEEIQKEFLQYSISSFAMVHMKGATVLLPNQLGDAGKTGPETDPQVRASRRDRLKTCAILIRKAQTSHQRLATIQGLERAWPVITMLVEEYSSHAERKIPSVLASFNPALLHSDTGL